MKIFNIVIITIFLCNAAHAESHLKFYLDAAFKNNLKLNAERKNHKSIKQNINILLNKILIYQKVNFSRAFLYLVSKAALN